MKNTKQKHAQVREVGRFGLVGIANTVIDFVVLNVLVLTILPASQVYGTITLFGTSFEITGLIIAGLISGTLAMINSYIFNMRFTFKKQNVSTLHTVYFFVVTIAGLYILRPIVLKFLTDVWLWPSQIAYEITSWLKLPLSREFDERNVALFAAIVVVLVYNYCMYKYVVFTDEKK